MAKYHEYYDKLNNGKKNYEDEVTRLLKVFYELYGDVSSKLPRVLEVGSGTGNHTKELLAISAYVAAVDIDPEMIKIAKNKIDSNRVQFYQNISEVPESNFPLCVMMWHVLNYFPNIEVMEDVFVKVYDKLEDNGVFFFDAWNGVAVLRDLPRTTKNEIQSNDITIIHELNGSTSLMDQRTLILNKIEIYKDNKLFDKFQQEVIHHIWTPKIVIDLLKKVGFNSSKIVKVNDYSKAANEDDWKIMFVAQK